MHRCSHSSTDGFSHCVSDALTLGFAHTSPVAVTDHVPHSVTV